MTTTTTTSVGSGLSLDVCTTLSGFELRVALDVAPGEVLVVIGPNGSGKSTLLRTIAGLHPPDRGTIVIGNTVVDDAAPNESRARRRATGRVCVPARQRGVGLVFQDYQLFEHLDVLDNVAFGPRCSGVSRREARGTAREWLRRLDLEDQAALRPWQLSGGQQQRVALARALAESPAVLLLDEPLAALDVEVKTSVRRELRTVLADFGGACVIVTHDPVDVYALADRVAVLDAGQVVQSGTVASLTAHPRSRFVAELVGTNLVSGQVESDGSGSVLRAANEAARSDEPELAVVADFVGPAFATVRPSSIALSRVVIDSSARNTLSGIVMGIDRLGERVRVTVDTSFELVAEITVQALESLDLKVGDAVVATVKATDIVVYPA